MQMVKRIVGGFFLSLLLLWIFAPKQELYYLFEKSLKKQNIIISDETIVNEWFGLKVLNADVYANGIKVAKIDELNFNFFFIYSNLDINGIHIDESLHNMAPKVINSLNATYSIINPIEIKLDGEGSFGELNGNIALLQRKVEILFPIVKELKTVKKFLKKDKTKGWYYETNY